MDYATLYLDDGSVLISGGFNDDYSPVNDLMRENGSWSVMPDLPLGMSRHALVQISPLEILILGGSSKKSNKGETWKLYLSNGTLVGKAAMNKARFATQAGKATINGETFVLAVGGFNERTIEMYDINEDKWTMRENLILPYDLWGARVAAVDGKMTLLGGLTSNPVQSFSEKVLQLDADFGWTYLQDMPVAAAHNRIVPVKRDYGAPEEDCFANNDFSGGNPNLVPYSFASDFFVKASVDTELHWTKLLIPLPKMYRHTVSLKKSFISCQNLTNNQFPYSPRSGVSGWSPWGLFVCLFVCLFVF